MRVPSQRALASIAGETVSGTGQVRRSCRLPTGTIGRSNCAVTALVSPTRPVGAVRTTRSAPLGSATCGAPPGGVCEEGGGTGRVLTSPTRGGGFGPV